MDRLRANLAIPFVAALLAVFATFAVGDEIDWDAYFTSRTTACAERTAKWLRYVEACPAKDWPRRREEAKLELRSMLGLAPWPKRGDLHAVVTGQIERAGIIAEKLHFQSLAGLYVTGTFYRPAQVDKPLPTVLYLCGHGRAVENGVSLGNKTSYQHHGAWFARHGFCCLTIDTLQLGEIEGVHHGTYRENRWWWISRGYTPAGVEAWNAIRALDYLETRKEVDRARLGVTGRSGGGAYTWWLAALDDRPKCLVPVAGITDLENHVVDDCIEGHCDCMFQVNRLGWDFGQVAALAAPRALLLANSDRDTIFPLDGVLRIRDQLHRLYAHLGAADQFGLLITTGPHEDTQELQLPAFRWMNRWLRETKEPIDAIAEKLFAPRELKVFDTLPADERNTSVDEWFVPKAEVGPPPETADQWQPLRHRLFDELDVPLRRWGEEFEPSKIRRVAGGDEGTERIEFTSKPGIRLGIRWNPAALDSEVREIVLHLVDEQGGTFGGRTLADMPAACAWAFFAPRHPPAFTGPEAERERVHFLRRFVLLGTTLDEERVGDVIRAVRALRESLQGKVRVTLAARGTLAGVALYAGLFDGGIAEFQLENLPVSHDQGPIFINISRMLEMPQALSLAFPRSITLVGSQASDWEWAAQVARLYPAGEARLEFAIPSP